MISHTKRIWDNISLKSNKDILLTGIGVYLPYTKDCEALICVDARPLEKPLRPLDVETQLDSIDDAYTWGTTTIFAKVNIMQIGSNCCIDHFDGKIIDFSFIPLSDTIPFGTK